MAIKKYTHARKLLLACLIILMMVSTGCKQQTTPRPPLSADEVKTIAAEFERVSKAHLDAWNKHDTNLMRQLYTDDIMFYETGNISEYHSIDNVLDLNGGIIAGSPDIEVSQVDTFIGREDGFDIWEMWNYWEEFGFKKDNPATVYDWITLREGEISEWWQLYDSEVFTATEKAFQQVFQPKYIQAYETAWTSGDPEAVASLYDSKVVRKDTLFGEDQQGSSAIKEFATKFFTWYPGVRLELIKSFGLAYSNPLMTGGEYAIHVIDRAGKPCDVHAIVLLESSQDKIINEWVFYQADSLIACGWAQ
jgi:hypothetical protein